MSEILLCNQSLSSQGFKSQCGIDIDQITAFSCEKPTMAAANTPYMVGNSQSNASQAILGRLSTVPVAKELTNLSLSFGGDNVVALAEITANLQEYNIGLMGVHQYLLKPRRRFCGFCKSVSKCSYGISPSRYIKFTHESSRKAKSALSISENAKPVS